MLHRHNSQTVDNIIKGVSIIETFKVKERYACNLKRKSKMCLVYTQNRKFCLHWESSKQLTFMK